MIVYFDTSAIIPLLFGEPSSITCTRLWNDSDRSVSVRLLYPEARSALARARRMSRISAQQLTAATDELETIVNEVDHIEITRDIAHAAGELAQTHGLRGHNAVHLSATMAVASQELVLATGDTDLAAAARSLGVSVAFTS